MERYFIALFVDPDSAILFKVLPFSVNAMPPARFTPITGGEHLQAKIEASHRG